MIPDTLVQIDLSDENSWDQIDDSHLTADEKRVLREQFQEDTDAIIYLTEAELQDFKNILASEIPEVVSEELQEFSREQITQGVSLTDFTSENNESLGILESSLHQGLFGESGIFKLHEINLGAQNGLIAGLSLSILEQIGTSQHDVATLISNTLDTLSVLEDACNETLPVMGSPTALHIAENGEANEIFMDPIKGQEFFSKILSGELGSTQEIQEALKNGNTDDKIIFKPEEISLIIEENLRNVTNNGDIIQVGDQDVVLEDIPGLEDAPGEEASDEEKQSYIDKLKEKGGIFAVLAGILEFIQGARESITGNTESDDETTEAPEEEVQSPEELEKNDNLINMIDALSPVNQDHIEQLRRNPTLTTRIRLIIEGISAQQTFEETFQEIFDSGDILSSKGFQAGNVFEEYGFESSLQEGLSDIEKGIKMLEEYSRYRNSDGVRGLDSGRTTWESWAAQRQAENWSVGGR